MILNDHFKSNDAAIDIYLDVLNYGLNYDFMIVNDLSMFTS